MTVYLQSVCESIVEKFCSKSDFQLLEHFEHFSMFLRTFFDIIMSFNISYVVTCK